MKKLMFFNRWDNKLWGDDVVANPYFASISIVFAGIIGATYASAGLLRQFDIINYKPEFATVLLSLCLLTCLNIAESIMSAKTIEAAIFRSILVVIMIAAFAGVGFIGIIVFALVLIVGFFIMLMLNGIRQTVNVRKTGTTLFGKERYEDDMGRKYVSDDGGETVRRE